MTFVKGQSGNPGGRPKKEWTWSGILTEVGDSVEVKSKKKFKELVAKRIWVEAVNGNLGAIKEIFNRMDGMPPQSMQLSQDPDNPINPDVNKTLQKVYGGEAGSEGTDKVSDSGS